MKTIFMEDEWRDMLIIVELTRSVWGTKDIKRCILHLRRTYSPETIRTALEVGECEAHLKVFDRLAILM